MDERNSDEYEDKNFTVSSETVYFIDSLPDVILVSQEDLVDFVHRPWCSYLPGAAVLSMKFKNGHCVYELMSFNEKTRKFRYDLKHWAPTYEVKK